MKLLLIIVLASSIVVILFLLWQKNNFRSTTTKPSEPSSPTKKSWWGLTQQAFTVLALLTALTIVLFPDQAQKVYNDSPRIVTSFIFIVLILCIGGEPKKTIATGRKLAKITLVILLTIYIFWPAITEKFPELAKINLDNRQTTTNTPTTATTTQFPNNAVLLQTLAPGKTLYITIDNMASGPPERWAKELVTGEVMKVGPWPPNTKSWGVTNSRLNPVDIYVVLPPNQNIQASLDDPALVVKASDCPIEEKFGQKQH